MKQFFFFIIFAIVVNASAQVGIGNTNPQASLDIAANNMASPSNTDGILIPRIDDFPSPNPGLGQDGMMVFVTGNGTPSKGFYYWDHTLTSWISVASSKNTLDEAYDEGGSGVGRDISATDGAVRISGEDGFEITGTYGSGDDLSLSGSGTRLFFNPKKAAFRAGRISGNQWNLTNIGNYSFAVGNGTYARGEAAFAAGSSTAANGRYSTSFGTFAEAFSYAEMAIGSYPTEYVPANPNGLNLTDRAFVIGNSNLSISRSNAFEVWKDGRVIINEAYTLPTTDGTNNQVLTTDGAGNIAFQDSVGDGDTQNTLDAAYDEGGSGVGKTIIADTGAVRVDGTDGFLVTGTLGSGNSINTEITGSGTRMFFNPNKAAFRVGGVSGSQWDNTNIGLWSIGFGANTIASGTTSTAFGSGTIASGNSSTSFGVNTNATGSNSTTFGQLTTASGNSSTSFGVGTIASGSYAYVSGSFNTAPSFTETVMGTYATNYTPAATGAFNIADKLFVIGNGTTDATRSNALTIFKSGLMNINDAYNMPLTDGTSGQVLTTDGAGTTSWQNASGSSLALARITMSANQTFTGFNDDVKINFDTVDFDLNSNFNTTTDRFVATTAGYYRINGSYRGSTATIPSSFSFDIAVNGNYVRRSDSDDNPSGSIHSVIYLVVNDYVELNFSHSASVTIFSFPQLTYFEIEQIR